MIEVREKIRWGKSGFGFWEDGKFVRLDYVHSTPSDGYDPQGVSWTRTKEDAENAIKQQSEYIEGMREFYVKYPNAS